MIINKRLFESFHFFAWNFCDRFVENLTVLAERGMKGRPRVTNVRGLVHFKFASVHLGKASALRSLPSHSIPSLRSPLKKAIHTHHKAHSPYPVFLLLVYCQLNSISIRHPPPLLLCNCCYHLLYHYQTPPPLFVCYCWYHYSITTRSPPLFVCYCWYHYFITTRPHPPQKTNTNTSKT